jgi:hypothetical protein
MQIETHEVRHTHVEQVAEVLVLNFQEAVLKIEAEHVFGGVRVALRFAVHIIEASDNVNGLWRCELCSVGEG